MMDYECKTALLLLLLLLNWPTVFMFLYYHNYQLVQRGKFCCHTLQLHFTVGISNYACTHLGSFNLSYFILVCHRPNYSHAPTQKWCLSSTCTSKGIKLTYTYMCTFAPAHVYIARAIYLELIS